MGCARLGTKSGGPSGFASWNGANRSIPFSPRDVAMLAFPDVSEAGVRAVAGWVWYIGKARSDLRKHNPICSVGGTMKTTKLAVAVRTFVVALFILGVLGVGAASSNAQASAAAASAPQAIVPARITQAINEQQLVRFQGNVHPLARPEFDRGIAPPSLPMPRLLLLLKRSPEQQAALNLTMSDLYNAGSPGFHKWLTPEEFGRRFGPADTDIAAVTSWLGAHGFQVAKVSKGKLAIEFSGTAAQVQAAFHTEIHKFVVDGEEHWANTADPQFPAALAPVLQGIASLNTFRPKPTHRVMPGGLRAFRTAAKAGITPELNTTNGNFDIGPADFATIYNVAPLYTATPTAIDGSGQSIAVLGVSNINVQDVRDFRTFFGLPANDPQVVIDGSDPGDIGGGSEVEALLDVEYAGGIAKGATIHLVIAADTNNFTGLELAIFNVLDNNSDPIMNLSFGQCELGLGSGGNIFFHDTWEQASAQGITVTVSTGDSGAAGCEDFNATPPHTATTGLEVNGFASTPFNVAVGGTDFNDAGTQATFFNNANDPVTKASAKGYIPETTWNESCTNAAFGANAEANCNLPANANAVQTVGASGGMSHCTTLADSTKPATPANCAGGYAKPTFQLLAGLTGMPADGKRDLPDVSLFSSSGFNKSAYAVCIAGSCQNNAFLPVGGTSAAAPAFAGIMALVNQSEVLAGRDGRQGNANIVLYQLAKQQFAAGTACNSVAAPLPAAACTFNDVTNGTIAMPCTKGFADCTTNVNTDATGVLSGFSTTTGYDLATGLGSLNVKNLVNNWGGAVTALQQTTTTLSISPTTGIVHGTTVNMNITVAPVSGTVKPTGDVTLVSTATTGAFIDGPFFLDAAGTACFPAASPCPAGGISETQLTGGTYSVVARYAGDGTFAPSISNPVTVSVTPQASGTLLSILDPNTGNVITPSGTYPQTAVLRADVSDGVSGRFIATGTVNFVDNGGTTLAAGVKLNSLESAALTLPALVLSGGSHSVVAHYNGDASFNPSISAATAFTITAAATTTTASGPANANTGQSVPLSATVTGVPAPGAAPTGTITFKNGATTIAGPINVAGTPGTGTAAFATASATATFATAGAQTITAVYSSGDSNYANSTSAGITITVATGTNNPVPTTTAPLSPATAIAGGAGFTLTVNGTNFVNTSVVNFNGNAKVTTFVSATQITAAINAADIAVAGTFNVTVTNPPPVGGTSTPALTFTVSSPLPTVTSLSATTATVGDPGFTLTVTGTGFVNNSVVNFGGTAKATTFVSSTTLNASILAADLLTAGTKGVTVTNPAPGGGTSTPAITFTINNPSPILTSINPTTVAAGSAQFTLTVTGSQFTSASVVNLAGVAKATTFGTATALTATITAADIATGGTKVVTVTNPAPGGGTSTGQPVILTVTNGLPTVTLLAPTTAVAGSAGFTLTVTGTNFVGTSVVNFGGAARTTTFVSATSLTASILASDIAAVGTPGVTVTNPAPGGGTSTPAVTFTVTAANSGSYTVAGTTPAAITAGGNATSTITATPTAGGFAGTVAVTCTSTTGATSAAAVGITCTPNPLNIALNGLTAASGTLTIAVAAPSTTLTASNLPSPLAIPNSRVGTSGLIILGAGTGLGALFLLFVPGRKRLRAALGLGLVCVISLAFGCSGNNGGGGGGPVATTTTLTVDKPKNPSGTAFNFTIAVTGGATTPTGMVQLFDGGTAVGTAVAVDATGHAAIGNALPTGVGTHTVSAHYVGDSKHNASASGNLMVTEQGTTALTITGTSGATSKTGSFNITVN